MLTLADAIHVSIFFVAKVLTLLHILRSHLEQIVP